MRGGSLEGARRTRTAPPGPLWLVSLLTTIGLLVCGCSLTSGASAGSQHGATARSGHRTRAPKRGKAHYVTRPLPYDPGEPPTFTSYTPPGTAPLVSPAPPLESAPPCSDSFIAGAGTAPGRELNWALDYSFTSRSPSAARVEQVGRLSAAKCRALLPLLTALASSPSSPGKGLPDGLTFEDWRCGFGAGGFRCRSELTDGAFVLTVRPAQLAVSAVRAGALITQLPYGKSEFARTDYYVVSTEGLSKPSAPAPPGTLRYFMVVGEHACGASAGVTEREMVDAGGGVFAIVRASADLLSGPFYLRLSPGRRYHACVFLQPSASSAVAAALVSAAF